MRSRLSVTTAYVKNGLRFLKTTGYGNSWTGACYCSMNYSMVRDDIVARDVPRAYVFLQKIYYQFTNVKIARKKTQLDIFKILLVHTYVGHGSPIMMPLLIY
jgi:hypothetical protein